MRRMPKELQVLKRRKINKQTKVELQKFATELVQDKQITSVVYSHVTARLSQLS